MTAVDLKLNARRKPRFKLPPLACDAHCHVFGPADKFPYAPGRRYTPADAPKETLVALHDFLGIERAVIVHASAHGTDHRALLDALAWAPKRFRGTCNAGDNLTERDFQRLHDAGVRGVRFNFVKHLGGIPEPDLMRRVLERVKPFGWHVLLHFDAVDIDMLAPMFRKLPVPFVIDHMGRVPSAAGVEQPAFKSLLELARMETCWIKVSGSERISFPPYDAALPFARALVEASPDRCLWGTDFPHPNPTHEADEADLIDLIHLFAPDPTQQRRLLVDNPTRLYDF
ncbi:MAG: amidohydrolase family protein [Xanthobacteraceae bacterium]